MAKNDFDLDFDFEKEYGFDPKAILDSEYTDDNLDLSQFDDAALGIDLEQVSADEFEDFDLDSLDQEEAPDVTAVVPEEKAESAYEADFEAEADDLDLDDLDLDGLGFDDEEDDEEDLYPDDADLTADMDFTRRANFFGMDTGVLPQQPEAPAYEEPVYEEPVYEEPAADAPSYEEPAYDDQAQEEYDVADPIPEDEDEEPVRRRRERPRKERKPVQPIKLTMPPFLTKLVKLYFPTQQEIRERSESTEGRRRRRPSKQQIFKEYYLPTIIAGLSVVLILSFVIGALSNAIDNAQLKRQQEKDKAQQESIAAEKLQSEGAELLKKAEELAKGYDYDKAIGLIDSYTGELSQEMTMKKSEYINARNSLVEHQDPTLIPNLSFHVLVADMNRAIADDENGGSFNRNFVSTSEFEKILNQLYLNNYVLVDFDSFVGSNSVDGTTSVYMEDSIWLPEGKKPVMLTETLVNYFEYMIDGNKDGVADAGGAGFASRLVVDANGDIKAEYVDASGATQVGNYDLVPILEDFIAQHPDFSYRGARATLAVCGYEGIFGYRIQSETIAKKGNDYYNEQVVGATKVVEALKNKGYNLACYSFQNKDYSNISAAQVNEDLQKWKSQISPVIGEIDTIVFARGTDIGDYTGGKFDVLYDNGFRFMIKSGDTPYTEVNTSYIRQTRLMVTGENMVSKASMFTDTGLFDPNAVLDLATRGNVPVG